MGYFIYRVIIHFIYFTNSLIWAHKSNSHHKINGYRRFDSQENNDNKIVILKGKGVHFDERKPQFE